MLSTGSWLALALCVAGTLIVFGIMLHSILTFHGLDTEKRLAPKPLVEAAWALVPMLILVGTAVPAVTGLLGFGHCP